MKTYSRIFAALLVWSASLLAATVHAQERPAKQHPATTIKQQPPVALETRAGVNSTPTPTPVAKGKLTITKLPAVVAGPQISQPGYPKMPNLVGVELSKARSVIAQTQPNAKLSIVAGQYTNNYQPGVVINQTPETGTPLRPGVQITLYYNPQPASSDRVMPNVRGQNVDLAEQILRRPFPEVRIRRLPVNDNTVQPNTIARQIPAAGQPYNAKTEVILYFRLADVTPTVIVPNVQGMSVLDARRTLSRGSLSARLPKLPGNTENYVITSQSPEAGTRVPSGSVVTLTVKATVRVPDVTRRTLDDAAQILGQKGLSVGSVTRKVATTRENEVLTQDPLPSSVVMEGTSVNLVVTVQRRVRVPDVQNQPQNNATQTITSAGLVVGQIVPQESAAAQGTVIRQNPEPRTVVAVGTPVNLVVAVPQTVRVPNLQGRFRDDATQLIPRARLTVGQVTTQESSSTPGTVLSQNPAAGARATIGSQVNLVVATPQTLPVPDLKGRLRDEATQLITRARLTVGQVTTQESNARTGSVLSQNPAAGASVTVGSQVNLVVAVPLPPTPTPAVSIALPVTPIPPVSPTPGTFLVPDVRKKELTEAISSLRAAQLEVGDVTKKDPKETASVILEQQPSAGLRVASGTRVNLVIGKPPDDGLSKEIPKVLGVLGLGFGVFLLGKLWKYFRTRGRETRSEFSRLNIQSDPEPPPPASALSFRTTMNASSPEFAASTELHTSFALQFQPKADWGQQYITLTGGLIAAESEEL